MTKPNLRIVLSERAIPIILGYVLSLYYMIGNQISILLGQSLCVSRFKSITTCVFCFVSCEYESVVADSWSGHYKWA